MRGTPLRLTLLFGFAAIAFAVLGSGLVDAQSEPIPAAEMPEGLADAAAKHAPEGWTGSGTHPGQADFDKYCATCHQLSDIDGAGPGLAGLYERIQAGPEYEGKDAFERVLEYVNTVNPGEPEATKDPYFQEVQKSFASPGVDMSLRGALPPVDKFSNERLMNVIHFMFTYRAVLFDEDQYLARVELGRSLVSGATGFKWGGPSCTGCHSIGSDPDLRGAGVAAPITHTYVLGRDLGTDEENNYADGLYQLLSGEDAPAMHYFYKDVEGSHPLTETELRAVMTFFEVQARETGTEQDSNYLPILALIFAALGILLLEPGVVNLLFAREDHEYIDGPYEKEHHDEEHELTPTKGEGDPSTAEQEPGAEESPEAGKKAEEKDESADSDEEESGDEPEDGEAEADEEEKQDAPEEKGEASDDDADESGDGEDGDEEESGDDSDEDASDEDSGEVEEKKSGDKPDDEDK